MNITLSHKDRCVSNEEITSAIKESIVSKDLKKVLIIPPDITRYYSNAGLITNIYYNQLNTMGCVVDILPALGTHEAVTEQEAAKMFGDIPYDRFIVHDWRNDVESIGEIPAEFVHDVSQGVWNRPVSVELNRLLLDKSYDLIISVGQVVPHEVIGMANHSKNLFVGVGGSNMINSSHMIGAFYGMERLMGKDHSPVRKLFDYACENYIKELPILYVLTVTTADNGDIDTHGLFIGEGRNVLEQAIELSQQKNIHFVDKGIKKCVVYLEPAEFRSSWLGNKAVYRTRMAIADGGELIVLAPGVTKFGEDEACDLLIRKYGYCGRESVIKHYNENNDLQENQSAAAHLIHGSSDGRFSITYAVKNISKKEIEQVGFCSADYDEMAAIYNPEVLSYGYNTLENGEEIYYIPNPALGLWINKEKF